MTVESLAEILRAHLRKHGLHLVDGLGQSLNQSAETFAVRELAEVASDALSNELPRWERSTTREMPAMPELLEACR